MEYSINLAPYVIKTTSLDYIFSLGHQEAALKIDLNGKSYFDLYTIWLLW